MSEASTQTREDDSDPEAVAARLDALEGWQSFVEEHVFPRIDDLEATVAQRDETIEQLQGRVQSLEGQLEVLDGLTADQQSTPQKRATDLARAMMRQAETRADGRIAKYYREVKEDLATLGHETLKDPQAYSAMEDVAKMAGFGMTTVNRDGKQVKAVGLNLNELERDGRVNEINNAKGTDPTSNTTDSDSTTDT